MPSMGSVGDAFDNGMADTFFATVEKYLLDRRRFKTQAEAKLAMFEDRGLVQPASSSLVAGPDLAHQLRDASLDYGTTVRTARH